MIAAPRWISRDESLWAIDFRIHVKGFRSPGGHNPTFQGSDTVVAADTSKVDKHKVWTNNRYEGVFKRNRCSAIFRVFSEWFLVLFFIA